MNNKKLSLNNAFVLAVHNHQKNNLKDAVKLYMEILKIDPNHTRTINNLSILLRDTKLNYITQIDRVIVKELLLLLFRRTDIDHKDIFLITRFLLFNEKNFTQEKIKKIINADSLLLKNEIIRNLLKEELFLLMLQKSLVVDHLLEKMLTKIRYEIFLNLIDSNQNILKEHFDFIISLAEQCFLNEYIYAQQEKEINYINKLKNSLENNEKINEIEIVILGCYLPLYYSESITNKLLNYKSTNILFNDFITMQVKEPLKEKKMINIIKSHGKISNIVSKKVRDQYEQNPYPRWRYTYTNTPTNFITIINSQIKPNKIKHSKKFDNPNILIAGCGTGRQIILAKNYLNASILGVDLSLSSLAYAKRKTEELNFKNIKFLHADILQLKNLNKKFDVIECVGVLHHMHDPLKGLRILINLLEPHGLLRLGLYSEFARQDVIKIREFIKKNKLKNTTEDIRNCRKVVANKEENKLLKKLLYRKDFYSTSSARDLMFHVKEHRFTLKQLSKILKNLNLEFLGFTDISVKSKFSKLFPKDKNNISLDNWNQFEKDNTETFMGMYNFIVRRKIN